MNPDWWPDVYEVCEFCDGDGDVEVEHYDSVYGFRSQVTKVNLTCNNCKGTGVLRRETYVD